MDKIIYFDKVKIKLNNKRTLNNINLDVIEKDFIYLIGKTGSGKSSILRTIYADLSIEEGKAKVLGYNLIKIKRKEIPHLRRKVGVIFQDFKLTLEDIVNSTKKMINKN